MESRWERAINRTELSFADLCLLLEPYGLRPSEATLIDEGKANTNYRLRFEDGAVRLLRLHVRDPKAGALEKALTDRLAGQVPVARVLVYSPEPVPFSVLEWLPGRTMESLLEDGRFDDVLTAAFDLGFTLAHIASVRFDQAGWFDSEFRMVFGKPSSVHFLRQYLESSLSSGFVDAELAARVEKSFDSAMPDLLAVTPQPCLSHADYKASNLMIDYGRLVGVLDWEFAHSGTWLLDAGQLFRHESFLPSGFEPAFERGFVDAGGVLPPDWRRLSRTLDLANLVGFLARPNAGPIVTRDATGLIEATLAQLSLASGRARSGR